MIDGADTEGAVIAKLLATETVTSRVADRIEPGSRSQGSALPSLVLNAYPIASEMTHDGPADAQATRIQIDAYGETDAQRKGLAKAVRLALDGFRGTVEVEGADVVIQGVFGVGGAGDLYEGEAPDRLYRTSLDFIVWAVEP